MAIKKKGVTIEIVSDVYAHHHIGDGGSAVESYGRPRVKIGNVNMPIKDMDGRRIGIITSYIIEDGNVKFEAFVKDTPQMRRDLGIDGDIGISMGCALKKHAAAKRMRSL